MASYMASFLCVLDYIFWSTAILFYLLETDFHVASVKESARMFFEEVRVVPRGRPEGF